MERRLAAASSIHPDRQLLSSVPLAPRLGSVALRQSGTGLGPLCRRFRLLSGNAKLRGAGVHLPFPLVELSLPVVGGPIPGVGHPVPPISDLISPVSNEIALVSGPRALLVA